MHLTGFRFALTRTLNDYAKKENLSKENNNGLSGKDVREGLTAVISLRVPDPQFEGQTKRKLGNPEARTAVAEIVGERFYDFLERNPQDAKAIIESCILAQKARNAARAARETIFKTGIPRTLALPGKLAECTSRKPEESEIFVVEGPSAGGSAKMGRDRKFQAILPLRGKILNIEKARLDKILSSEEIKSLIVALGTGIADDFDIKRLRYHKIVLMLDADSDGNHIKTLLLTLLFRYFRKLIENGHIYIAQPPLYKIQTGKQIKYAYTENGKDELVKLLAEKERGIFSIQRYKGLGEMNAGELWETTMDPEKRILLKVEIEDAEEADRVFDILMGEEVQPRKKFIQIHAKKAKNLDI
jgi:DNA gyrase subunit B